ncbi:MAG: hypothetical protein HY914_09365 [Desulfomonile tiedjei]|nr:hypothetical protein [Desulfomonile tiedjei]
MNNISKFALCCLVLLALSLPCSADPVASMKVMPESVDYPLIRQGLYPSQRQDPYEAHFCVHRWLNPLMVTHDVAFEHTMTATKEWFDRYGGYGVTGHGEDVFTRKGAEFRRSHRGR